jgi:phosphoglycolate phosphatase-like HAD superfamily hydrolase
MKTEEPILFVWDFHGVLEKDNELAVHEVTNRVLEEFGYGERASHDDILRMYGLPWGEYFRLLVPGIEEGRVDEMVSRCVELGRTAAMRYCRPRDHAFETLKKISEEGHSNILVSNTGQDDLQFFMGVVGVEPFVDEAFGVGRKATSKADVIKVYASKRNPRKIVAIGDTEKDVEAGLVNGATTFLFNPDGKSVRTKADHVITDLRKVLRELDP